MNLHRLRAPPASSLSLVLGLIACGHSQGGERSGTPSAPSAPEASPASNTETPTPDEAAPDEAPLALGSEQPSNEEPAMPVGLEGERPGAPASGESPGESPPDAPPSVIPPGFAAVEALDRGVVAVMQDGGVYVGWRMLGYEYDRERPERVSYNLYRDGTLLANVTDSTNFRDAEGSAESTYAVAAVIDGAEGARSTPIEPWQQNFLRVPLESPGANYSAHDASLGDADGDGQYEIFMLWQPSDARDNETGGVTSEVFIDALRMDGTRLWRMNLGPNIRAGEHYTQFIVIDADGDGQAELAVKTAPGTRDGTGAFLRTGPAASDDDAAIHRNEEGRVLDGPEYYTVFSGLTGEELATAAFDVPRGPRAQMEDLWGDDYGNRVDRFLATAAYLDDTGLPSLVIGRGYYERSTLTAWNYRDGALSRLWRFDSNETPADAAGRPFTGQGAHSVSVANVDGDPQQEIIYGAMTVDHDGRGMCSTGMNHGDALHASDFMPQRPGIEVFMPTETRDRPHWTIRDGANCELIRQAAQTGADVGRGVAADVTASSPGAEFWASSGVALSSFDTGAPVGGPQARFTNFLIWWDADELRELEDGTEIAKVGGGTLLSCNACASNNGTKSVPNLVADLLGDWREEVIWRQADNSALRIYTTTDVTTRRIYTLMHDPQYRAAISWQNVAYNQPPHPSFFIGAGMDAPPVPDIRVSPR